MMAGSGTNNSIETTSWMPEPNTRGTFRLLVSCVVTLALCIHTALHLNVPQQNTPAHSIYLQKARWILMGMLAPELVVYAAWKQWYDAKEMTTKINGLLDENSSHKTSLPRQHRWTIVHSFYANMGGFVIDSHKPGSEEFIPGSPRLILTSKGVVRLAKCGYLPDISKSSIIDRSKADNLAKALVCVQASWMIFQCITRIASHLPVTFLEINTLGHVLCALLIYSFWWHKPLDVRDPTAVSGDRIRELSALMYMCSGISNTVERGYWAFWRFSKKRYKAELLTLKYYGPGDLGTVNDVGSVTTLSTTHPSQTPDIERLISLGSSGNILSIQENDRPFNRFGVVVHKENARSHRKLGTCYCSDSVCLPEPSAPPNTVVSVYNGQSLGETLLGPNESNFIDVEMCRNEYISHKAEVPPSYDTGPFYGVPYIVIHLDSISVTRWELASRALSRYWALFSRDWPSDLGKVFPPYHIDFMEYYISNWPSHENIDLFGDQHVSVIVFSMATAAYGGLHALAWGEWFPTAVERLLWKISALFIASSGLLCCFVPFLCRLYHKYEPDQARLEYISRLIYFGAFIFVVFIIPVLILLVYAAARTFLVVEAFISIRSLPVDAYATPVWTQFLPHL